MTDIAACLDHECPSKHSCYRYTCHQDPKWQAYVEFDRKGRDNCEYYWNNETKSYQDIGPGEK